MTALTPLLAPRSLVIVGASPNLLRTGGIPLENHLRHAMSRDGLYLVNPKYREIEGLPCHSSVADLPCAPDLAVLAIRADEVLTCLRDCHARGIRAAVVFASGFAEERTDRALRLQDELVAFARASNMKILGPNCMGYVNFEARVLPTFLRDVPMLPPKGVAAVTQSGNMASVFMRTAAKLGLGLSFLVSTGNEAVVDLAELLEYFADDPGTRAVIGYVEQIRDGTRFVHAAARLRAEGKPIFLLKAGQSEKGAEAAASHTAAMAGSAAAYATAFRQLGIATATDPYRLMDLTYLWRFGRRPARTRVAVVSLSGAACALLADGFARHSIEVPSFSEVTQAALSQVVPSYGMVENPVDLTGQVTNDAQLLDRALGAISASVDVDAVVFYVMGYLLDQMSPVLVQAARATDKMLVVIDTSNGQSHAALEAAGIAVFTDIDRAVSACSTYLRWVADQVAPHWQPSLRCLKAPWPGPSVLLDEARGKTLLAAAGLPMVREVVARSAEEAVAAQRAISGAVVVKVLSPDIAHKSEVGGVVLDLDSSDAVERAFIDVVTRARKHRPDARIEGAVVQPMAGTGVAMLIGVTRDPVFGPMMTVGMGGVLTELYRDVAHRILPVDASEAEAMLRELKCFPLLDGYRGTQPVDRTALVRLMVLLSDYMCIHGGYIHEVELNPVIVHPGKGGVTAVDALVRVSTRDAAEATTVFAPDERKEAEVASAAR